MSFSQTQSIRFLAKPGSGNKPRIFWEEQEAARKKKQKFSYKGREQKNPIRSKLIEQQQREEARKERENYKPKSDIIKRNIKNANSKDKAGKDKQNKEKAKLDTKKEDYVTLTQNQFDKILETIGELTVAAEQGGGVSKVSDSTDNINLDLAESRDGPVIVNHDDTERSSDQKPVENGSTKQDNTPSTPPRESRLSGARAELMGISPRHMTKAEKKKLEWERQRAEAEELAQQARAIESRTTPKVQQPVREPTSNTPSRNELAPPATQNQEKAIHSEPDHIPGLTARFSPEQKSVPAPALTTAAQNSPADAYKPPPTKAQLKRMQWEAERAALQKEVDYNPWGRPGAGAPAADNPGLNSRKKQEPETRVESSNAVSSPNNNVHQYTVSTNSQAQVETSPYVAPTVSNHRPSPSQQDQFAAASKAPPPPAAIRSSFHVGNLSRTNTDVSDIAIAPDENRYESAKQREKNQWLKELEQQREEQRQRKLAEKQKWKDQDDTWADRFATNTYKPHGLPEQPSRMTAVQDDSATGMQYAAPTGQYDQSARASSAPNTDNAVMGGGTTPRQQPDTYLRGQNVALDPATKNELEEKRRKQLEHQEYIRQQIEEKARIKREAEEKRKREEQEEEDKLRRELDNMKYQYSSEQQKAKEKEEAQQRHFDALKKAMDDAKEQAERDKHQQRMAKLQKGGHDVSHLHASFEVETHRGNASRNAGLATLTGAAHHTPRSTINNAPTYVPGLDLNPAMVNQGGIHVEPDHIPGLTGRSQEEVTYIENRVLTPTQVRRSVQTAEFGVQTADLDSMTRRESTTEILYKGSAKTRQPPKPQKKVRVRSAPEEHEIPAKPKKPIDIRKRPKWGQTAQQKKKPLKQSEKDPFYAQKKKRMEENKIKRAAQHQKLREMNTSVIPEYPTTSSRNRSRSRDRYSPPPANRRSPSKSPGPPVRQYSYNPAPYAESPYSDSPRNPEAHRSRLESHRSQSRHISTVNRKDPSRNISPPVPSVSNKMATYELDPNTGLPRERTPSPPIPAIKHRIPQDTSVIAADPYNYDQYQNTRVSSRVPPETGIRSNRDGKYMDDDPLHPPAGNGDFVPIIRSNNILDPAHAESPLPMSREASTVQRGRKAYHQERDPAKYGALMENFDDNRLIVPASKGRDPLTNPGVVKEHPSQRQNKILQQLGELRRGLVQKQRELEIGLAPQQPVEEVAR